MANVDFTLQDIKKLIDTSIGDSEARLNQRIDSSETRLTDRIDSSIGASEKRTLSYIDTRFKESNLATVELVGTILDHMDQRFTAVDERFDHIEHELKTTSRLVRRHSIDIMELRASA